MNKNDEQDNINPQDSNEIELFHGDFKAGFEKQNKLLKLGYGLVLVLLLVILAQSKISTGFRYVNARKYVSEEVKKVQVCDIGARNIILNQKIDTNLVSRKFIKRIKDRRIQLPFRDVTFFPTYLLNDSNKCKVTFSDSKGLVGFVFVLKEVSNAFFKWKIVDFDEIVQSQKQKF